MENVFFDGYISCCNVPELNVLQVSDEGLLVGAAVTLTDLMVKVDKLTRTLPGKLREYNHSFQKVCLQFIRLEFSQLCWKCSSGLDHVKLEMLQ